MLSLKRRSNLLLKSVDELAVDAREVENSRSIDILKRMDKNEGFTSLEDTLVKALDTILENQSKNIPRTRIDMFYESLSLTN